MIQAAMLSSISAAARAITAVTIIPARVAIGAAMGEEVTAAGATGEVAATERQGMW
jgi:hypothetical protein